MSVDIDKSMSNFKANLSLLNEKDLSLFDFAISKFGDFFICLDSAFLAHPVRYAVI